MTLLGNWTWLAVALVSLLGAIAARYWFGRLGSGRQQKVNLEYFKGLNFLLNEEADRAIEVFIKALEVDKETVELHLALGGLFRRQGQVDRATRIHQNLIARPTLTEPQRMQAVYELAQDYYKAGLLDRAENLFLELLDSTDYRSQAIDGLCRIYQQEKEWRQAIDILKLHRRPDRMAYSKQVAHYYCELAESALEVGDLELAGQHLRSARREAPAVARVNLLRGKLSFAAEDFARARRHWHTMTVDHPEMAQLVVADMIAAHQQLDDRQGLREYLLSVSGIPKDDRAFNAWLTALTDELGAPATMQIILERISRLGLSGPVARYLFESIKKSEVNAEFRGILLNELLDRAKNQKIEYTCSVCGFDTKALYWFCPNCGEWESFQ